MFDLGWTELLVIGIVALIVVGPKDLPVLFRKLGQFVGKAKGMAREFTSAMNDAADQSGVREVTSGLNKSLKAATNPVGSAMDGVKSAAKSITRAPAASSSGTIFIAVPFGVAKNTRSHLASAAGSGSLNARSKWPRRLPYSSAT